MSVPGEQNVAAIDQGLELLEDLRSAGADPAARVGPHFRHCIDFYDCFLQGRRRGRIDYDARERSPSLESSLAAAAAALRRIRVELLAVEPSALERTVAVRADAVAPGAPWTTSTIARELLFLQSHTIHHYALIALLLRADGFEVPPGFGVAPSTLEHRGRQPECAR